MTVWLLFHMMVDDEVLDGIFASEYLAEAARKALPRNGDRGSAWIEEHEVKES